MELAVMKAAVGQVREEYAFSQRRACGLLTVAVSSYRYQSRRSDEGLRRRLVELAREKPRFGYRRLHVLLRRSGEAVNHKRVQRVYREAGLSIQRKKRKPGAPSLSSLTGALNDFELSGAPVFGF
jgi:putative transposase